MSSPPRARIACKLFVCDLDGTILVDEGPRGARLPGRAKEALRRLAGTGVTVCLASGRMHESIMVVAQSFGFEGPVISHNGAVLRLQDGSIEHHHPLESSVSDEIIDFAEDEGIALNYYVHGQIMSRRFHPWWDLYEGRTCSPMREVESLRPCKGGRPTKLLMMAEPARIRELQARFKPYFAGRANVLVTGDEYLEFMAPQVNKGAAMLALAGRLGVQAREIVAAGDGYNDLEMLQAAGCAVAVKTGRQAVQDIADFVVAGPEASGVAEFIESHLLDGHG